MEDAQRLFDTIQGFGYNNEILYWHVSAAANLIYYGKESDFIKAKKVYGFLEEMGGARNEIIQRELSRANYMFFYNYLRENKKEEAEFHFDKINSFGSSNDILGWKTEAITNYLYHFIQAKDSENALKYYTMALDMPSGSESVECWQAYATYIYMHYMVLLGEIHKAEGMYVALMSYVFYEEKGTEWQEKGALFMFSYYLNEKEYVKALQALDYMREKNNFDEILEKVVAYSFTLLDTYLKTGKIDDTKELYERLKQLNQLQVIKPKIYNQKMQEYWHQLYGLSY